MPKAETIITGQRRTRKLAIQALSQLGEVDESTLTAAYMPGIEIDGKFIEVPATKYTAEVEPNEANKRIAYGNP